MKAVLALAAGPATNVFLSSPVVAFSGDPGDPPGRCVELPLRTSFELP